jgi:NitT/TauT family transport system ATP-binding protein
MKLAAFVCQVNIMIVKILLIFLSEVNMLKLNKVSFTHDNQELILSNLSTDFHERKINCLMGPNGSGKTTLIKLIGGILLPTKGKIINTNKNISYVFQEDRLIKEITVYQNLDLVIRDIYRDKNKRRQLILKYLKLAEIEDIETLYPHQLSGSMKQRVSLIRAFIHPSTLLLLDEPYIGLDINARKNILNLTLKLWKRTKKTIVFVSHDIDLISLSAHYAYVLSNKPIRVLKEFNIKLNVGNRDLYCKQLIKFKKEFYELTNNW